MGSEVFVGARVCVADGEPDGGCLTFSGSRVDDKGTSNTSKSSSWIKKENTELCRRSGLMSRLATEDASQGLDHGTTSIIALMSSSEVKQTQWKVTKVPRNGSGSCKKLRMLQTENSLPQAEADDPVVESDKLGMHLVKCLNSDKSAPVKQKSNINGRRGDRRNYKVGPFSLKAGMPSFNLANGGTNAFGMYGLKPDIHDVTKLINDISLDELHGGSYKYTTHGKEKEKEAANVNENILDSVRKACSVLRLQGLQQGKQDEVLDTLVNNKISLLSSPSRTSVANDSGGDASSLTAGLSKCNKDLGSCIKVESLVDMNIKTLYQPKDMLQRLALPPPKDLEILLQDAMKPAASGKPIDSRSSKTLSHGVTLPTFPWSNNFNGHYKLTTDATRISIKTTCQGRWARIRSTGSFIGGDYENFTDLESLTYDDSLVPAGHTKYRLPEIAKTSSVSVSQDCGRQDISSAACSTVSLPPRALHSPIVLTAAQTLCDIASHCTDNLDEIMKCSKQPSQKAMKARKSRSNEKTEVNILTAKSETILDHVIKGVESGYSSKKPKISVVERRQDFSHVQAVIGLTSVSASKLSRSSPSNGTFTKPSSFIAPLPPRSNHNNPQKLRKIRPMDWNRTRS